jgi:predicted O-methyltransferase YrrM
LGTLSRGFRKFAEYRKVKRVLGNVPPMENSESLLDFVLSDDAAFIRPFQIRSEISGFLKMVMERRPTNVLEIGTANGGTLFLWTRASAPDATLASIDLPGGDFGEGYPVWKIPLYKSFALPSQTIHLIRANSHAQETVEQLTPIFRQEPLDFLFIDGDHSYDGVKRDFELYSPLVRKGGLIALHDVAVHTDTTCQVHRLWDELKPLYRSWEFIENPPQGWGGIGVLEVSAGT